MVILSDSASSPTPGSASSEEAYAKSSGSAQRRNRAVRTLAPNLTRRSHKKSRAGCFNCKSRKIKCQETCPQCENCALKELDCIYPPTANQSVKRAGSNVSTDLVVVPNPLIQPLHSTAESLNFTLTDLQFFHHFLTISYPHLPLNNDHVWVQQIPLIAQQHPYLMSAILSEGASHLTRISPNVDYTTNAIVHRGNAMRGLNAALNNPNRPYGEADAMLATCYALSFQAFHMGGDSLFDFITMVRGCALVTDQMKIEGREMAFTLDEEDRARFMSPRLDKLPTIHPVILTTALDALVELQLALESHLHHQFHTALMRVILSLRKSSREGYFNNLQAYGALYNMSHKDFEKFINPGNAITKLVLVYFVVVQLIMAPLAKYEFIDRLKQVRAEILHGIIEWAESLFPKIPIHLHHHLDWPKYILATVRAELSGQEVDVPVCTINMSVE